MYDSGPSDEELKAFCLTREDVEDTSDFEIWPENWIPFLVFLRSVNAVACRSRRRNGP
jgi:hypothetical protein